VALTFANLFDHYHEKKRRDFRLAEGKSPKNGAIVLSIYLKNRKFVETLFFYLLNLILLRPKRI